MTRALLVVALVVAVTVALVTVVAVNQHHGTPTQAAPAATTTTTTLTAEQTAARTEATAWQSTAVNAIGSAGLATLTESFSKAYAGFKSGKETAADFRAGGTVNLQELLQARDTVLALAPYPGDPLVGALYGGSLQLYAEWFRLTLDVPDVPAGPVRDQLDLLSRRVEQLSNRVFDRGVALLDVDLRPPPPGPDVVQEKVQEVPNWVDEGLAAGPPLDASPGPAAKVPPRSEASRPTGPRAGWIAALGRADPVAPTAVAAAIGARDGPRDQALADRLLGAAEALRAVPDPVPAGPGQPPGTGREESARVRLGLEIDAEAARSAQLAALLSRGIAPGSDPSLPALLDGTARRLLLEGTDPSLWSADLGPHASGLDPALLRAVLPSDGTPLPPPIPAPSTTAPPGAG